MQPWKQIRARSGRKNRGTLLRLGGAFGRHCIGLCWLLCYFDCPGLLSAILTSLKRPTITSALAGKWGALGRQSPPAKASAIRSDRRLDPQRGSLLYTHTWSQEY